jgi:hypothetical protein
MPWATLIGHFPNFWTVSCETTDSQRGLGQLDFDEVLQGGEQITHPSLVSLPLNLLAQLTYERKVPIGHEVSAA